MIRAVFERRDDERMLTLQGHATGSPAVCAAASAIVYALAGWLQSRQAPALSLRLRPGDAWVLCQGGDEVDAAFAVARTGLDQLAGRYPELVHVVCVSPGRRAEAIEAGA